MTQGVPGPTPPTLITLRDASVSFSATRALQGIDLELRRGDRLALLGANGSGKTTLLRLLHGLQAPDACPAPAPGTRISPAAPAREVHALAPGGRPPRCAMVFQRPFLLHLSVRANVALGLWLQAVPAQERAQRAAQALQRVGLAGLEKRRARDLSGGQQQRLALARAWALQPDILFLDEPAANLDPTARRELEALVLACADEGMTIVLSTHHLGPARRLATRVACLEAGRLVTERPTAEFFGGTDLPEPARRFLEGELA